MHINIDQGKLECHISIKQCRIQNKEDHQRSIHQEDITTLDGYASDNRASKYMKQNVRIERRNVVKDFKTFLSVITKTTTQKASED